MLFYDFFATSRFYSAWSITSFFLSSLLVNFSKNDTAYSAGSVGADPGGSQAEHTGPGGTGTLRQVGPGRSMQW